MIEIKNISFSYGEKAIFQNFSLTIDSPVLCISGTSGIGKTTLLRIIAGLIKPSSGTVSGVPAPVSVMFQDNRLIPWLSALENIALVINDRNKAKEWLDMVELSDVSDSLPENMSGGQCRRAALARALAFDSKLLLLDEPFKGLDPELTERMAALILKQGKPVITVTHSAIEAALLGGKIINL